MRKSRPHALYGSLRVKACFGGNLHANLIGYKRVQGFLCFKTQMHRKRIKVPYPLTRSSYFQEVDTTMLLLASIPLYLNPGIRVKEPMRGRLLWRNMFRRNVGRLNYIIIFVRSSPMESRDGSASPTWPISGRCYRSVTDGCELEKRKTTMG